MFYFRKILDTTYNEAIERTTEVLKKEGFGILTEIDIKETLKKKLGVEFQKYIILGACNPPFAFEALKTEDKVGLLLPCNVVVQELKDGKIEVSAIDPIAMLSIIDNPALKDVAEQAGDKLKKAIEGL